MKKGKIVYQCQNCDHQSAQWQGQCAVCGAWNTLVESVEQKDVYTGKAKSGGKRTTNLVKATDYKTNEIKRISTNIGELDRVLGDGFVEGQVVLLGGAPGVGKSTLLTKLSKSLMPKKVLYVCGEESIHQVHHRISRMQYDGSNLHLLDETDVNIISEVMESNKEGFSLIIVDSIQTLYSEDLTGMAGSISQIRGCTQILTTSAKRSGIPTVLVGHITKEGVVAGPKVLEHIVDTVLYLEGDEQYMYRVLRTSKNRFGQVSEVGIFEMNEEGMREVKNPSEIFLSTATEATSGSCITVVMEGQRPLFLEIQALTIKTMFGYPRRTTSGYNVNRLQLLLAILEKRCGLSLSNHDVYLNVAGGMKISENASDLAVCIAIASSFSEKPLPADTVVFGECGLGGEIRKVPNQEKRIKEATHLGYKNVVSPSKYNMVKKAVENVLGKK